MAVDPQLGPPGGGANSPRTPQQLSAGASIAAREQCRVVPSSGLGDNPGNAADEGVLGRLRGEGYSTFNAYRVRCRVGCGVRGGWPFLICLVWG